MALGWDDLALLSARFGVARFGASRFGFVPCPEDVKGAGFDEPGEYIYAEQTPPTREVVTPWTLVSEDCVCRNLCTLALTQVSIASCLQTNNLVTASTTLSGVVGQPIGVVRINWGDGGHEQQNQDPLADGLIQFTHNYNFTGSYTVSVSVTDERGCVATTFVPVVIADPMSVSIDSDDTVDDGVPMTFTPIITGGTGPYTYQWQFETDALWDDLKAYWNLSSEASQRGQYPLTNQNGVTFVAGQVGNAASFDEALQQMLYRPGSSTGQVDIDGALGITLAFWLKVRAGAPAGANYFFDGQIFWTYLGVGTGGAGPLTVYTVFSSVTGSSVTAFFPAPLAAYDTWYFIAVKYAPSTKKIYISQDGGAWVASAGVITDADPSIGNTGAGNIQIGGTSQSSYYSRSDMDEIALFNTVKSDADIALLYNSGIGTTYPGSIEEIPDWIYDSIGTKHVTLTVTDAYGCTATASKDVTVEAAAATTVSGLISFVGGGEAICPGTTVHLINVTTPADLTTVTDVDGNYLFTNPAGFVQDDEWYIHIEAGAAPCIGGDVPVDSSPHQTWNEETDMTQDLDIPGL